MVFKNETIKKITAELQIFTCEQIFFPYVVSPGEHSPKSDNEELSVAIDEQWGVRGTQEGHHAALKILK